MAGGFAIALVFGYRTRLAAVVSLGPLVSLHIRNPIVLNAGDVEFRRLLLWGCFLPLGCRWSLDAPRETDSSPDSNASSTPGPRVASLASAALLLQVVTIYTANVLFKLRSEVWLSGSAVGRALAMGKFSTPLADLLVQVPVVLELATWTWLALLASAPLLVLAPGRFRTLHVALFAGVHVGMLATMALGIFPLVLLAGMLPFLPSTVWARLEARLPTLSSGREPRLEWSTTDGGRSASGRQHGVGARIVPMLVVLLVAIATTWNLAALGAATIDSPTDSTTGFEGGLAAKRTLSRDDDQSQLVAKDGELGWLKPSGEVAEFIENTDFSRSLLVVIQLVDRVDAEFAVGVVRRIGDGVYRGS